MLTMPRLVTLALMMCAGSAGPIRIGPSAWPGHRLDQVVGGAGRVEVRHDQEVGRARALRVRQQPVADVLAQRRVGLHLAVDLEVGARGAAASASRIFSRRGRVAAAEVGVADQRHLGLDAEAPRTISAALMAISAISSGVGSSMRRGVGDEQGPLVEHQGARRGPLHLGRRPMTWRWRRWSRTGRRGPASMASASPRASMTRRSRCAGAHVSRAA